MQTAYDSGLTESRKKKHWIFASSLSLVWTEQQRISNEIDQCLDDECLTKKKCQLSTAIGPGLGLKLNFGPILKVKFGTPDDHVTQH